MSTSPTSSTSLREVQHQESRFFPLTNFKNTLLGRVTKNWKETLLIAAIVLLVIDATLSFFTGYWLLAAIELSISMFLSQIRRNYLQFTNLHLATENLKKENAQYQSSNQKLQAALEQFQKEKEELSKICQDLEKEKKDFALNNAQYQQQILSMETTLQEAEKKIDATSRKTAQASKKMLQKAFQQYQSEVATLQTMGKEILKEGGEKIKKWERIVTDARKASSGGLKLIGEANAELQRNKEELNKINQKIKHSRKSLHEINEQIKEATEKLKQSRKELQEATTLNLETARRAHQVVLGGPIPPSAS